MAERITLELVAHRRWGDPEIGTAVARLNPQVMIPVQGEELLIPSPEDLLGFDRRLGGPALDPSDPALPDLMAEFWAARRI